MLYRDEKKKQWFRNLQSFQMMQADKKREDDKTARDTENRGYKIFNFRSIIKHIWGYSKLYQI